jgi:4-hydroxyphenylacetate 3-monooxygenase
LTRTGAEYLESLRDGREVWYDGERVADVTAHPAFRGSARSIAHLYDMTHDECTRETLTHVSPETGTRVGRGYQIPLTQAELVDRRRAFKVWSEASFGFLGRSPDYMASAIAGMAAAPDAFTREARLRANVLAHHRRMSEGDLFQAHTVVNPQIDRTKGAAQQEEDDLYVRVVDERDGGIVVRGAKMIGTGAVFGDEIMVGTLEPMGPDDAAHAVSFSVPVATPGVRILSRTSYEARAVSVFDNPLASRFDENDSLIVYDNVLVPWERVFVYRDVKASYDQWWTTPAFINFVHHGATRFWTKLEFLAGLGILIAKANNVYGMPPVQAQIGRLLAWVNTAKAMVLAAEAACEPVGEGVGVQPNRELSFAHRAVAPDLYPKVLAEVKLLAGGSLIQMPSSYRDLLQPELAAQLARYVRSPRHPMEQRVKLFKLAWDAVGSEFAGRHDHYERFYHGAPHAYLPAAVREGRPDVCEALAEAALAGYELPAEP